MATAEFRFYEELNEFLPKPRRKRGFAYTCARRATVKQAIEALGVPHTEVELVFVNGDSVDFSHIVGEGERISVYPQFEALDVTSIVKVRPRPLRRLRFLVDAHLGALARYLRMLGFDTAHQPGWEDGHLADMASRERRVLLTRDRSLLMRRVVTHGCYLRATAPREQLREIVSRLDLYRAFSPFTRCMECNGLLEPVEKQAVADRLPPGTLQYYDRFVRCTACDRVYWPGSHYRRMCELIEALRSQAEISPGAGSLERGSPAAGSESYRAARRAPPR